jgi:hypothetical protein
VRGRTCMSMGWRHRPVSGGALHRRGTGERVDAQLERERKRKRERGGGRTDLWREFVITKRTEKLADDQIGFLGRLERPHVRQDQVHHFPPFERLTLLQTVCCSSSGILHSHRRSTRRDDPHYVCIWILLDRSDMNGSRSALSSPQTSGNERPAPGSYYKHSNGRR